MQDYILNGRMHGPLARDSRMRIVTTNPGLLRPYLDRDNIPSVTIFTGKTLTDNKTGRSVPEMKKFHIHDLRRRFPGVDMPVWNATSLRKEEWIAMDERIFRAVRIPMQAWADLAADNPFTGFDGWSNMTLEYEAMSDPGEAIVDMEGTTPGRQDEPLWTLRSIPMPITHSDFHVSDRRMAVAERRGIGFQTIMGEAGGRRIGETIERTTLGTETGITFGTQSTGITAHEGTSTVYGYTSFPDRITKTDLTTPTGTNPEAVMVDLLEALEQMRALGFYGPYRIYMSTGYSRYINDDYFRTGSTSAVRTLRERLMEIEGIESIRRLNFLTSGYQMIIIDVGSVLRPQAVIGMRLVTVQWPTQGGMMHNFKTMCIMVPRFFSDYNGLAPVLHATTT